MRWDGLFADLEAQAAALATAERAGEIEDRTRSEVGRLAVVDRLRASTGSEVRLTCRGGLVVPGVLNRVHAEWILLAQAHGRESLVAVDKVLAAAGIGRPADVAESPSSVEARLGLRYALRRIARDRSAVRVHLLEGVISGTLDRVGADFVDLAVHAQGEARRRTAVSEVSLIPVSAIVAVSRDAAG